MIRDLCLMPPAILAQFAGAGLEGWLIKLALIIAGIAIVVVLAEALGYSIHPAAKKIAGIVILAVCVVLALRFLFSI
jgi:hypothetical protein